MENSTNRYTHLPGTPSSRRKVPLLWLCLLLATSSVSRAQCFTTSGTDFWVAMMPCWLDNDVDSYYLSASGPRSCSITIENPNTGWSHTMTIAAGGITTYQLPNVQCWQAGSCIISNTGLHVTSTDTVQLWSYLSSQTASSCDASLILPSTNLGTHYIVQTTPVDNSYAQESHAQFSVLAIEDGTVVDMVLTNSTSTGIASGSTITRTLNAGQVFQVKGPHQTGDFSGTTVRARDCKKIAVFSGASATNMPYENNTSSDETYHQNLPIAAYSTEWILTPTAWHDNSDYVRITSPSDNCQIYRNGNLLTTINAGQTYQFKLNSPAHVATSHPAALYQYLDSRHNSSTGGDWGDVAMFAPNPINQTTKACTFPCLPVRSRPPATSKYYVNVVVPTAETALLKLDGNPLTGFSPFPGTNYSYIRQSITNSAHAITTTGSGFSAYTYGLGENWEAYAMSLGGTDTSYKELRTDTVVIDTGSCKESIRWRDTTFAVPSNDTLDRCDTLFIFNIERYPSYADTIDSASCLSPVLWDNDSYSVPGTYDIRYRSVLGCDSTLHLVLSLLAGNDTTFHSGSCTDQLQLWDSTFAVPGQYNVYLTDAEGCDSLVHLTLDRYPGYETYDTVYLEEGETHTSPDGQTYSIGGRYDITLQTIHDCDSLVHVTIISSGCNPKIWIPNVFTPSLEGNNLFRVVSDNVTEMTVSIYRRQGDWICSFDGLTEGWDGTKEGRRCPEGTYVYFIRYKTHCLSRPKSITGTVTVIY